MVYRHDSVGEMLEAARTPKPRQEIPRRDIELDAEAYAAQMRRQWFDVESANAT